MLANKLGRSQQNVPGAKRLYQRDPTTSWGASAGRMGEETSTGPFLPKLFYKSVNFGHSRAPFLPSLSGKGTNLFWQRPPSSSLLGSGVYILDVISPASAGGFTKAKQRFVYKTRQPTLPCKWGCKEASVQLSSPSVDIMCLISLGSTKPLTQLSMDSRR